MSTTTTTTITTTTTTKMMMMMVMMMVMMMMMMMMMFIDFSSLTSPAGPPEAPPAECNVAEAPKLTELLILLVRDMMPEA